MPGERIEFVSAVSATATVRLSLTAAPWAVLFEGTDVSPPPIRRTVASSMLTDGASIPAAAYDNRIVKLALDLRAATPALAATELQRLNRELDRPTNILRWQPEPSVPAVYFRTFQASDYGAEIDHGVNRYSLVISLMAEPFSLGLREDITAAVVSNDPAAGSNGRFFDVTGVKGDVETPLRITVTASTVDQMQSLFATRRRGTPSAAPLFVQCESMVMGTDTATSSALAATMSPGSGTSSALCTFATTSTLATRVSLSALFPTTASVDVRGTYRVFVRCDTTVSDTDSYTFQLKHGNRLIANRAVGIVTGMARPVMIDLGLVQFPEGSDPVTDGATGAELSVAGMTLQLLASRTSGSGQVHFDYMLFIPADDRLSIVNWGVYQSSTTTSFVYDGYQRMVYALSSGGAVADAKQAGFVGDPPMVSPNVTNRVYFVRDVNSAALAANADAYNTTVTLNCSYWPRYLSIRPITT